LIGAAAALDHILRAKLLPANEALATGLVDEVVPAAELKTRAKIAALRLVAEKRPPFRPTPPVPAPGYFAGLRQSTAKKLRDQQPAPLAVIEVVEQGAGLDPAQAFEIEARVFGRVTAGEVCKNLVEVFFLRDAARKRTLDGWFVAPAGPLPPVKRVGVVGAGVMGSGIAHWLAASGYEVVLRDVQPEFVERGREVVSGLFAGAVKRGQLSAAAAAEGLGRLTTTTAWDGFATCDLVIEAIVENVDAKRQLFAELAAIVRPDTLLVSNTSALPIEEIAGHVPRPERTLGVHFFNPVSRMPLVELVISRSTSAESAARVLALTRTLGKSPVISRSSPGFLMTRVLFFYLNEAVKLWEQGVPAAMLDGAMRDFGWPMGPLRLIDEVGVDVSDFIFHEMAHYFPARLASTHACTQLLAAGLKGRKNGTGAGFYTYVNGREAVNEAVPRSPAVGSSQAGLSPSAIVDHLMGVMIDEACLCLKEGVVLSPADVDFALLSGAGFPAFRGGLMRYARSIGRFPAAVRP
jgi:3-hydroxyacyl-CoA dehydrogenase/enoyl-CoA hydratase/3-hydroxybutyryl-CoA epimerase